MLVTAARFFELPLAYIVRGRLEVEGIPAFVAFAYHVGNNWFQAVGLLGAHVLISSFDVDDAVAVGDAAAAGEYAALIDDMFGPFDPLRCPACGSADCVRRRPLWQSCVRAVVVFFTRIPELHPRTCLCRACRTQFRAKWPIYDRPRDPQIAFAFAEATLVDVEEILDVRRRVSENTSTDSLAAHAGRYSEIIAGGGRGWVCRIGPRIYGFALVDIRTRELAALHVHPYLVRNGIGRQLHNSAVDFLFARGRTAIHAVCRPRTAAARFFSKAGWAPVDFEAAGAWAFELTPEDWQRRRAKF